MKKLVLIVLVAILGALNANAQEVDSLSSEQMTIVDSLSMKLAKLQHDYDFLKCDYELNKLLSEVQVFKNDIQISKLTLSDYIFNKLFDVDLYIVYKDNYELCIKSFELFEAEYLRVKSLIAAHLMIGDFSERENEILDSACNMLGNNLALAEHKLSQYKNVLDLYKQLK